MIHAGSDTRRYLRICPSTESVEKLWIVARRRDSSVPEKEVSAFCTAERHSQKARFIIALAILRGAVAAYAIPISLSAKESALESLPALEKLAHCARDKRRTVGIFKH